MTVAEARPAVTPAPLLAWRGVEWASVRRARFYAHQRFVYTYPSPIRDLSHRLMVTPPPHWADQRLLRRTLRLAPRGLARHDLQDRFGNPVTLIEGARVRREASFEVTLLTERAAGRAALHLNAAQARVHQFPTALTTPDALLLDVAARLRRDARTPADLAQRISDHVSAHMVYAGGVTHVGTTAAEAYRLGAGLCQDYAHIALTLCRAAGLPARYVSGHMPGEGSSHAWLEALLPGPGEHVTALPLDPTNARTPHLGYALVTVGNDFQDVSPTSGVFTGAHPGALSYHKHAGLVELEYEDGEVVRAG